MSTLVRERKVKKTLEFYSLLENSPADLLSSSFFCLDAIIQEERKKIDPKFPRIIIFFSGYFVYNNFHG